MPKLSRALREQIAALNLDKDHGPDPGESFWHRFRFVRRRWYKKHGGVWYRAIVFSRNGPHAWPFGAPFPWRWSKDPAYGIKTALAFDEERASGRGTTYCVVEIDDFEAP